MSRPSLGNAGSNWGNSDLPVWEKLRLVAKNERDQGEEPIALLWQSRRARLLTRPG